MSPAAPIEPTTLPDSFSSVGSSPERITALESRRFADLRGVQWRIDLGILPSSSSSSSSVVDDLRRVTANSRRSYATLRKRLLVDPHIPKDGRNFSNPVMDNPLSQNPDSMWSRFFQNAELEKMVDQDLSRLYPEQGSYFQTTGCQGMLRRILLLWCLGHPQYGYRQGMHELLAPLLYVLHCDIEHLAEVRKTHEDFFTDKFDGFSFHENDLTYKFDFKKFSDSMDGEIGPQESSGKVTSLEELDPKIQTIVFLSDAYGTEGELGIVLSEKFMEHDAYCMFDALMNGGDGAVAMADFFSHSPSNGPQTGLPPVIEASAALYNLLSVVDSSLYSHLIELGVEPQYFALRWLRVLFGREFALEDLLIIWDEIFAYDNNKFNRISGSDGGSNFGVFNSNRGAFISAIAVSMMLCLRSSLLATENATSCLQRLLNFPDDINLGKLISKAKSLLPRAIEAINTNTLPMNIHYGGFERSKSAALRGHSLSLDCSSPGSPLNLVPDSYWEEKWRNLHKEEERKKENLDNLPKRIPNRIKGWSEKVKLRLSRTESDPSRSKVDRGNRVRRSLLEDLARQLGSEDESESNQNDQAELDGQKDGSKSPSEERCLSGNVGSEDNSSIFSDPPTPTGGGNDHNNLENDSERSSVASNLYVDENELESNNHEQEASPLPISDVPNDNFALKSGQNEESTVKQPGASLKEKKLLSGKFQWIWKFGRNGAEEMSAKAISSDSTKASDVGCINQNHAVGSSGNDGGNNSGNDGGNNVFASKGDAIDQNMMATLKNLGQSMLENIQVIESVFQQDKGQMGSVERGQVTAMAALKELRKISNVLSEM